jgi:hypothetical protein
MRRSSTARAAHGQHAAEGATARAGAPHPLWSWILLFGFVAIRFGPTLGIPFLGDDYVFLDRTRDARVQDLWSLANADFGWFRPWSRDVHFWVLQHLFGPNETVFRATGLVLWFGGLALYQRLVCALAGARAAWLATAAVAALELWAAPLIWISGSQDLWMIVWVMAALWAQVRGRWLLALPLYALALLSKETAAALPVIAFAYAVFLGRLRPVAAFRRVLPMLMVTLAWLAVHPTLVRRFVHADPARFGADVHFGPATVLRRTLLSNLNADFLGHRLDWFSVEPMRYTLALLLLLAIAWLALRIPPPAASPSRPPTIAYVGFGASWAAAAWAPLFQASVGWHAYYGGLGAMGAWLALSMLLERRPRVVMGVLAVLCVLHLPAAASSGWDWGSEWYQRRAGNLLGVIREQLAARHPVLPRYSRLYFGSIPNNIGLVAGNSPAIRVWYRDSTLEAGFFSYYHPRPATMPPGPDLFFHFDSTAGIREVVTGPEDMTTALRDDPDWVADHKSLAMTLLTQGSPAEAAVEFEKIARFPDHAEALGHAAIAWEVAGRPERSAPLLREFARRSGSKPAEIEAWAERLRKTVPRSRAR